MIWYKLATAPGKLATSQHIILVLKCIKNILCVKSSSCEVYKLYNLKQGEAFQYTNKDSQDKNSLRIYNHQFHNFIVHEFYQERSWYVIQCMAGKGYTIYTTILRSQTTGIHYTLICIVVSFGNMYPCKPWQA